MTVKKTLTALVVAAAAFAAGWGGYAWWTRQGAGPRELSRELEATVFPLDYARIPPITLQTGSGPLSRADLAGRWTLLYLGFTHCPDVCPMTLSRLSAVMDELKPRERRQLRILFVSVDPGRDSPARLRDYTDAFGPRVIGATADKATLKDLTSRYFMTFSYGETDEDGNYDVRHNGSVLAFDRQGKARLKIAANSVGGTPSDSVDAIVADLRALLSE